jgi:tRNA modification GTPase
MITNPTICAISTAPGQGAIAVIRVFGREAITICDKVFTAAKAGKKLVDAAPNTIHYGSICDGDKLIDEVLVSVFKAPRSFTGENSVEIACHGSKYIQQQLLQLLVRNGAQRLKPESLPCVLLVMVKWTCRKPKLLSI